MGFIGVRIDDELETKLKSEAKESGMSFSDYVRLFLENRHSFLDVKKETEKPQNIAGNMASNTDILSIKKTMENTFDRVLLLAEAVINLNENGELIDRKELEESIEKMKEKLK